MRTFASVAPAIVQPPATAGGSDFDDIELLNEDSRIWLEIEKDPSYDQPEPFIGPPDLGALDGFPATTPARRKGIDIWIEKRDGQGNSIIWYSIRDDGARFRSVKDALGICRERIE